VIVLTLIGDHDLATKPALAEALGGLAAEAATVIDLTRCTFIDAPVIGAMLGARPA
jgi:anti-anti-sigma regulatory factor